MTQERQKQIDRIHRISDWCVKIILLCGFVVMFFYHEPPFWWTAGILLALAILVNTISSYWATDEEKEQHKADMKEILQEMEAAKKTRSTTPILPDYSPLCNLTEEQEKKVTELLHNLPSHANNQDAINMAFIAQHLRALEQLGLANLKDKKNLRLWVAQVTQKQVPATSPFNEAISNAAKSRIAEKRRELERIIGSLPPDNSSADGISIAK